MIRLQTKSYSHLFTLQLLIMVLLAFYVCGKSFDDLFRFIAILVHKL